MKSLTRTIIFIAALILATAWNSSPFLEKQADPKGETLAKKIDEPIKISVIDDPISDKKPVPKILLEHHETEVLSVPEGLEGRVKLWETVYGDYSQAYFIIYNRQRPDIIYGVVYDLPRRRDKAIKKARSMLLDLDRITRRSADPLAEISKRENGPALFELYRKFENVPGPDRFRMAALPGAIGALRGRRNELIDAYKRAAPYLPAMEKIFEEHGVPRKITRLVFVESMFDREAESSKGAAGVWQFMPDTAKKHLVMTQSIDERRDPIASTRAAAMTLKSYFKQLGSWPLAVTAYNAGVGRMSAAIKQTGSNSLPEIIKQYEHRSVGFAVENFYARLLAILRAEEKLEFKISRTSKRPDPLAYDLVPLPRNYTLDRLAKKLGMDKSMLIYMNPAWTKKVEESKVSIPKGYLLRVPAGSEALVRAILGIPPSSKASYTTSY